MNDILRFSYYCTGCGLCHKLGKGIVFEDDKGFYRLKSGDEKWLHSICPCGGRQTSLFSKNIWGRSEGIYLGWSSDSGVRKKASSGGIITELCSYLLESGYVDGVIHTMASFNEPTKTLTCISTTREELVNRCGSRYAISHPLEVLPDLDTNKRYAFVGKPCDIDCLTNFMNIDNDYNSCIVFTISFFCAGLPSNTAQEKLLEGMGCELNSCKSLRYRGNGWPGYATAVDRNGKIYKMDYDTSWGKILGRDLMPMCRFCLNGIGETADISCGDAWYVDDNGKPDFSEHEGRNVIFSRTTKGNDILQKASDAGKIILLDFNQYEKILPQMQYYQLGRRQSMKAKRMAMKIFGKRFPDYPNDLLNEYRKNSSLKYSLQVFKGTVSRIINKSI